MVIAILVILVINLIFTGIFYYLTFKYFKKPTNNTKPTQEIIEKQEPKKEEPVPEEPTSELLYSLAKNIQTKWYDLNEDDNER